MSGIHPSAIVDPDAELGTDVSVGPFTTIGPHVTIGDHTRIDAHCVIEGPTKIGAHNHIYPFAALGQAPQDKKYRGEATELIIGDHNTIREYTTFNRGTVDGGEKTIVGDRNWIMAYVHIAHDCMVGNDIIMANAASLAGHVAVEDHAILGGFSLVHQFCRIGAHSFTSMGSTINRDVPPYCTVAGRMAAPRGINSEGLKRRGYSSDRITMIRRAYKLLYKSGLPLQDAVSAMTELVDDSGDVQLMVDFIAASERSIIR